MDPQPEAAAPSVRAELETLQPKSLRLQFLQDVVPFVSSLVVHAGVILLGVVAASALMTKPIVVLHEEQTVVPSSEIHPDANTLPILQSGKSTEDLFREATQNRDPEHANGVSEFKGKKQDFSMGGGEGPEASTDLIGAGMGVLHSGSGPGFGPGHGPGTGPGMGEGGPPAIFSIQPSASRLFPPSGPGAKRIVFVCDATGTMINKLGILKQELSRAIDNLRVSQSFNVIFYTDGGKALVANPDGLMLANQDNKRKAFHFLEDITATGTTDPIPAIETAFKLNPQLLYFLSDGEFNNLKSYDQVIDAFKKNNTASKIKVNTTLFETYDAEAEKAMQQIAKENGGVYRYVKEDDLR